MRKGSFLCALLVVVMMSFALLACNKEPGPESGEYYNDAGGTMVTITLRDVDKFDLKEGSVTKSGEYKLNGEKLTLTFKSSNDPVINATYKDRVITIGSKRYIEKVYYTVSYDTGGGSSVTSEHVLNGKSPSKPVSPTRTGYSFAGWYTEAACTNQFKFGIDTISSNKTLFARWVVDSGERSFEVKLDLNYEDAPAIDPVKTVSGKLYDLPTFESRGGGCFN